MVADGLAKRDVALDGENVVWTAKTSTNWNGPLELKNKRFLYSDVVRITNNFEMIVGKGGFGTVYYGRLDETQVAVKMLSPSSTQGYKQFQAEVALLMRVHHKNLTILVGYCNDGTNMGLIYEFIANGNLETHLLDNNMEDILSWEGRLRIATEAAQGLEYLHNGCKPPIVHRDVKSTNILLNENFQAKLADFGLSRMFPIEGGTHVSTAIAGSPGYLDPEYYISDRLTEKSDVYSFGVVLLEIISSKPMIEKSVERTHITQWVSFMLAKEDIKNIVDPKLNGDFNINCVRKAVKIAIAPVSPNSTSRPTMTQVVMELNECLAIEIALIILSSLCFFFTGFISLDCGSPRDSNYTEATTGIKYISDAAFIDTGIGKKILPEFQAGTQQQGWYVRSFPEGIRNCYKLNLIKGSKYLIRAIFLYGNYDEQDRLPRFDLHIGPNNWESVKIESVSFEVKKEIIHVLSSSYLYFCLVNTGSGTPFISALEIRLLKDSIYKTQSGSLNDFARFDIGPTIDSAVRYKDDVYDRIWFPYHGQDEDWTSISTSLNVNSVNNVDYQPPSIIMKSAGTPKNASKPMEFFLQPKNDTSPTIYVYLHFAEIQKLQANESRQFNISLNGKHWFGPFSPDISPQPLCSALQP
ncbi:hypothetical protein Dsin_014054 [Dipteronia sinensis]|uniref:Protein kinase domain-containing protein n=1 Tax=Dipteronia sinensis TaxID=43782 RepID=A0AAE0AMC7_9ROSI|nr:hypothetical protein Dsin_014054 [Dipteronia sinensis]